MKSIKQILEGRSSYPEVEPNEYQDIFVAAILAVSPPSHWHHWISRGWISLQEWMNLCMEWHRAKEAEFERAAKEWNQTKIL